MCLLIQEGVERYGHRVHSFCFMSNHIHLAIQVGEINISRIIQNLAFRYTRHFNRQYKRIGHLFQGRFKSVLVNDELYLKELIRYIHLNPVRASMVDRPEEYRWSSHRAYLHLNELTWLTHSYLLKKFSETLQEAIDRYDKFLLKGIGVEPEINFDSGYQQGMLGDDKFVEEILAKIGLIQKKEVQLPELVAKVCEKYGITHEALRQPSKNQSLSHARAVLALLVREIDNLSLDELANFLNREPSGISKLASRLEGKCLRSPSIATEVEELPAAPAGKEAWLSKLRVFLLRKMISCSHASELCPV